jgi:site-specific recombinase XerD
VHVALGGDLLLTAHHLGHASTVTTQVYVPVDDERYERGVDAAAS